MANKYTQAVNSSQTRFTKAPMGVLEFSTMQSAPRHLTDFSAGDIVPIYCAEVLPHDTFSVDVDFVIRQATALVPSMGQMLCDIQAYWVPNRIVNSSWKAVQGENLSGAWVAPEVSLVPLVNPEYQTEDVQVPICSVADYYGFPTQKPLPIKLLSQCHDLKFRGYLEIYNNYFRDQNYQPPIPYSKLNCYNGFMLPAGVTLGFNGVPAGAGGAVYTYVGQGAADGSAVNGSIRNALYGNGGDTTHDSEIGPRLTAFSALDRPLKANKLHDYFTSVLPSPQKGPSVVISTSGIAPVKTSSNSTYTVTSSSPALKLFDTISGMTASNVSQIGTDSFGNARGYTDNTSVMVNTTLTPSNLYADLSAATSNITLEDFRNSAAIQQVYEILGRGGSRYVEFINSFFGLDIDNPFNDIPTFLGSIRRELDLYQTAQTSASVEGSSQGNLAAFGYTNKGGKLFHRTFNEHGYIHIFAIVRHKNIYPSLLARDNFRLNMLDFYTYPLANISEQPVYTREINPFGNTAGVFGYQEAWAEYRMEPDRVTGHMRTGIEDSLSFWNYADNFSSSLEIADGEWLKSNSAEVLNRSIAVSDTLQPQFKGEFFFKITKERPMPTYSVAGLDII